MNTEFWISNTTTCSGLISPSPFLISASLPRLSRRGMSSSVYLSHTPDWTTHYLTACHYSTSDWTTSAWTAQTMIGSLSISISDDVFLYLPGNGLCHNSNLPSSSHASSPIDFYFRDRLYGFTAKGIRRPMFVKHEDGLGFVSLRPLWLALIVLHP